MNTTTELARRSEAYYTHTVAILLSEQSYGTHLLCFFHRCVAMLVKRDVLTNQVVNKTLNLTNLFVGCLLEVREVEAKHVAAYERTFLLNMVAEHLLQGIVEQVGSSVVGSTCLTLVGVNTSHEVCLWLLWQSLNNVDRLSVLALCVDNVDSFCLVYDYSAIANLSTHFAIERSIVEYQLKECIFLLRNLAIAQYVTFIFSIVIANELLFAFAQHNPVGVFHLGSIAGTLFLLLHLLVELILVDGVSIFATYQFGKVERESVCIKQAERLSSVELFLSLLLKFIHSLVEH